MKHPDSIIKYEKNPPDDRSFYNTVTIAASRVTDSIYNDRLVWGWADAIWPDFIPSKKATSFTFLRMGDVLNHGKKYMSQNVPNNAWRKLHFEAYHWFGDPAMEIRTEAPPLIVATKPDSWPWALHPQDFTVHVDWEDLYGPGLAAAAAPREATVTISKQDSPDHWVGATDETGDVTFPDLVTTELGTYDIVVTAPNSIPYEGTFESLPGSAGGLRMGDGIYSPRRLQRAV